jgi:hypothetical protein
MPARSGTCISRRGRVWRDVEAVVACARERGADRVELWVVHANDAGRSLYRRWALGPTDRSSREPRLHRVALFKRAEAART